MRSRIIQSACVAAGISVAYQQQLKVTALLCQDVRERDGLDRTRPRLLEAVLTGAINATCLLLNESTGLYNRPICVAVHQVPHLFNGLSAQSTFTYQTIRWAVTVK